MLYDTITINIEKTQETKSCTKCCIIKKLSEFYERCSFCKQCHSKYSKQRYYANKEYILERCRKYREENHKRELERKKKYREANNKIILENLKKYREANPGYVSTYRRNRYARKRNAIGSHTKNDILNLLVLQKSKCAICRCSIKTGYHVDHVVPLSKGGNNDKFNLQLLCPSCNCSKHAKDPVSFMQERGFLL